MDLEAAGFRGLEQMGVTVRPADDGDIEALCEIYYDFHEFHVRGVPTHLRSLGDRARWDRSSHRALSPRLRKCVGTPRTWNS